MGDTEASDDGGASSIESWDDEPACTFNPDKGFAINQGSVEALRWYSYLRRDDEDAAGLLQSKNDD